MDLSRAPATSRRWHSASVVSAITLLILLVAAGVRTAPGVLIKPLEAEFGWSGGSISLAVAATCSPFASAVRWAGV